MNIKRDKGIDFIKGIAIILVVLGHVITNGVSSQVIINGYIIKLCNIIYFFHMPLFFFISGYLTKKYINENNNIDKEKVHKKILALIIPYISFSTIYLLTKIFFASSGAVINPVSIKDIVLIMIKPIGEYWFLYALIVFNILYFGLQSRKLYYLLGGVLAISCYFYRFELFQNIEGLRRSLPFFIYFYLGNVFNILRTKKNKLINRLNKEIIIGLVVFFLVGLYNSQYLKDNMLLKLIYTNIIIILFFVGSSLLTDDFIEELGRNTMSIYLIHPFFVVINKILFKGIAVKFEWSYIVVSTILSVLVPYIIYKKIICKYKNTDFFIATNKYL